MIDIDVAVKRVLAGDTDSFRLIIEQYQGLVFSVCLNMTRDSFEAENLAQETFLQAYRSLSTYGFRGLKPWLVQIATNKCRDYIRKRVKHREVPAEPTEFEQMGFSSGDCVEDSVMESEQAHEVLSLCKQLPDIYRVVIEEYYINSKSIKIIAHENRNKRENCRNKALSRA